MFFSQRKAFIVIIHFNFFQKVTTLFFLVLLCLFLFPLCSLAADPPPSSAPSGTAQDVNVKNTVNVNVKNKIVVDVGDGTGADAPSVQEVPSPSSLFKPLTDWVQSIHVYRIPSHVMQCPTPETVFFGRRVVMDSHCVLIDGVKSQLRGVMTFVFSIVAFFVLIKA